MNYFLIKLFIPQISNLLDKARDFQSSVGLGKASLSRFAKTLLAFVT